MTSCLLDYNYFNKYYKMIAIDLSKQQELTLIKKHYNYSRRWGEFRMQVIAYMV